MGVRQFLSEIKSEVLEFYLLAYQYRLLSFQALEDGENYHFRLNKHPQRSPGIYAIIHDQVTSNVAAATEAYVYAEMLGQGVKSFPLSEERCRALEETELSLPSEEYAQPFPTFVVDLAPEYSQEHQVSGTSYILDARGQKILSVLSSQPSFLAVHHVPAQRAVFFVANMKTQNPQYNHALVWVMYLTPGQSLEECWVHATQGALLGLGMSEEEARLGDRLIRLGLNAALLADSYGVQHQKNPQDLLRKEKLQEKIRKKKNVEGNQKELLRIPEIYEFSQEVIFYKREEGVRQLGEGTGRLVQPHWRRGHWRMQACGPALSLRKKIRIPAVLINAGSFLGELPRTFVEYKEKETP